MSSAGKQKQEPARPSLVSELFQFGLYKPNQGRIVRQVTFLTTAFLGVLIAWEIKRSPLMGGLGAEGYLVMLGLAAAMVWVSFRLVN